MDEITNTYNFVPFGIEALQFAYLTVLSTLVVITLLVIGAVVVRRNISLVPGPVQTVAEIIIDWFDDLVEDALGFGNRRYYALITGLFLFLLASNWIGMIPLPYLREPTRDVNTPMGMALIGFVVAHYTAINAKGLKNYLSAYVQPFFFMLPLNLVGEIAKVVSISFRLFGNIMGGAIITLVVSVLLYDAILEYPWLLPVGFVRVGLVAFFTLFVGAIQAFVFTMLTLVYISVLMQD